MASKKEIRFVIIGNEEVSYVTKKKKRSVCKKPVMCFLVSYVTKTIFAFIFAASTKRYFTNLVKNNALFLPRKRSVKNF